ncbi:MAG: hypothetical protein ACFFAN_08350 [Promethearchaeota archaeon]
MEAKYFLIGFIILTLSAYCATFNTRAANYSLGVSENDEFIWEVTIVNEEGLENLF